MPSPRPLGDHSLCLQIRGMAVTEAIAQMAFTPKERGAVFRMVLKSAAAVSEAKPWCAGHGLIAAKTTP